MTKQTRHDLWLLVSRFTLFAGLSTILLILFGAHYLAAIGISICVFFAGGLYLWVFIHPLCDKEEDKTSGH